MRQSPLLGRHRGAPPGEIVEPPPGFRAASLETGQEIGFRSAWDDQGLSLPDSIGPCRYAMLHARSRACLVGDSFTGAHQADATLSLPSLALTPRPR